MRLVTLWKTVETLNQNIEIGLIGFFSFTLLVTVFRGIKKRLEKERWDINEELRYLVALIVFSILYLITQFISLNVNSKTVITVLIILTLFSVPFDIVGIVLRKLKKTDKSYEN